MVDFLQGVCVRTRLEYSLEAARKTKKKQKKQNIKILKKRKLKIRLADFLQGVCIRTLQEDSLEAAEKN